jgi:hypothetical protein
MSDWMDPSQPLAKFRRRRKVQGRDVKVIITSRNSTTGTGKSTLAVWCALCWDKFGFDISKATLDPQGYIDRYLDLRPGECLIMDEAEQLDARRSMSQKNLDFAERWMELRYKQVDSILTMPTSSALDKRLEELADVWINVTAPGHADVYKTTVNDRSKEINQIPMQTLTWPDISDHHIKQDLDELKEEKVEEKNEIQKEAEGRDPQQIQKETRDSIIQDFYESTDLSQRQVAEAVDLVPSTVNNILN